MYELKDKKEIHTIDADSFNKVDDDLFFFRKEEFVIYFNIANDGVMWFRQKEKDAQS